MKQKLLLAILFFFLVNSAQAQLNCLVQASGDTTICPNTFVPLSAVAFPDTVNFRFIWSDGATLSDSSATNPVALPLKTTTYYVTITSTDSTELVQNGDFEQGDTLFTSSYRDSTSIWNEGTYSITNNPSTVHPAFGNCPDHTPGGGSLMFCVNGTGVPNTVVWSQNINVTPNTDYEFSAWIQNILPNPPTLPRLSFSINGQLLGPTITTPVQECIWNQLFTIWNSGNSTTATIEIINRSTFQTGNDFAIDDISFRAICKSIDSVLVTVIDTLPMDQYGIAATDTLLCDRNPITIISDYPDAVSFSWSTGESGNSIIADEGGTYTVTMIDGCNRVIRDSIIINEGTLPLQTLPSDTTICEDNPITLNAYQEGAIAYEWRGESVYFNQNNINDTTFVATYEGVYEVDVTNECGTTTQYINIMTENCACKAFVPNAFTPNNDGTNDFLQVYVGCEISDYRFSVYNRWGELVFASTNPADIWDGNRADGKDAALGVYVWKLEYSSAGSNGENVQRIEHGDLLLVR